MIEGIVPASGNPGGESDDQGRDSRLAKVLAQCSDRLNAGEPVDLDRVIRENPDLAPELGLALEALRHFEKPAQPLRSLKTIGDYRILREIGRGGMGIVYEAEEESLGRRVALKVLPSHCLLDHRSLERFFREARAAARLQHPNIVPVFAVGEREGIHYYSMQFIQGRNLAEVLQDIKRLKGMELGSADAATLRALDGFSSTLALRLWRGNLGGVLTSGRVNDVPSSAHGDASSPSAVASLPEAIERFDPLPGGKGSGAKSSAMEGSSYLYYRQTARIALDVARALAFAHGEGVIHRDIKPSNLLIDGEGKVWVADFGLAKAQDAEGLDGLTLTGDAVGTVAYMAPERFEGWSDARSDVYGLGMTLYEMATLRPAFEGSERQKLIRRVMEEEPLAPRKIDRQVPKDLETIILKATAKDPAHRYPGAASLAEDLELFLADRPIKSRRASTVESTWRWCRRNRTVSLLVSSILVLLLLVTVGSTVFTFHLRERLFQAYVARAQAGRWSGRPGRRFDSLEALERAAQIRKDRILRDEVIACLAMADVRPDVTGRVAAGQHDVVFDADMTLCASARPGDEEVVLRKVPELAEVDRIQGPGKVSILHQFSVQGRLLPVTWSDQKTRTLQIWNGRPRSVFRFEAGPSRGVHVSEDCRRLSYPLPDGTLHIVDLERGEEIQRLTYAPSPARCCFSPDVNSLAVTSDSGHLDVLEVVSGKRVASLRFPANILDLRWSPDGTLLAAGGEDTRLYVWETKTWRRHSVLEGHKSGVFSIDFCRKDNLLASSSWDASTRLWNPLTGETVLRFEGEFRIDRFGFDRLLTVARGEYKSWKVAPGDECLVLRKPGMADVVHSLKTNFHPNGRFLLDCMKEGLGIWDLRSLRRFEFPFKGGGQNLVFAPDGKSILTTGPWGLLRWKFECEDGSDVVKIGPPEVIDKGITGNSLSVLRNQSTVACMDPQDSLIILELDPPGGKRALGRHSQVNDVVWKPGGGLLASGTWHGKGIKVWDTANGHVVADLPIDVTAAAAFSPDGKWLVTSTGSEYRFWETHSWREVGPPIERTGGSEIAGKISFSPDGTMIAINTSNDVVTVIEFPSRRPLARFESPNPRFIFMIEFSPDGRLLAVSCSDGSIRLWNLGLIRERLAGMGLDWDPAPRWTPGSGLTRASPPRFELDLGTLDPNRPSRVLPRKETDVLPGLLEQARTLSSRGDLLSAIEAYGRVLTASPEEPVALNELAWIYATGPPDVRDPERALPLAEKAVRRKGDFEFLHTLGVVYLRLGRFPEAVETFMRSARAQGQGITAHEGYFLAICFQRLGMPTLAREYFDKASDWASSHPVSSELESFLREAEEVLGGGTPAQKAGSR